jgi:hypothetical protein
MDVGSTDYDRGNTASAASLLTAMLFLTSSFCDLLKMFGINLNLAPQAFNALNPGQLRANTSSSRTAARLVTSFVL